MSDDLAKISLCDLAYAYNLQYQECRSIAKNLDTQFPCEAQSLAELDAIAQGTAQTKDCLSLLLDEVLERLIKVNQIMRPDIYRHYIVNKIIFSCGNELQPILEEIFQAYLLGCATLNKKDAVIFLYEHGFFMVNSIPGLCMEYISSITGLRKRINIPPSLFVGKNLETAFNSLKNIYTDRCVMAAILQQIGGNKTDIGRLLYVPERYKNEKGREPDNATCTRTFNRLIEECKKNFIITFMEKI